MRDVPASLTRNEILRPPCPKLLPRADTLGIHIYPAHRSHQAATSCLPRLVHVFIVLPRVLQVLAAHWKRTGGLDGCRAVTLHQYGRCKRDELKSSVHITYRRETLYKSVRGTSNTTKYIVMETMMGVSESAHVDIDNGRTPPSPSVQPADRRP